MRNLRYTYVYLTIFLSIKDRIYLKHKWPIFSKLLHHYNLFQRNWSISCGENQESFRISIKKEDKGLVSTHMHDKVKIGDVLEVQY